jgi:hypothetical protein
MECPACGGEGCEECDHTGSWSVKGCPREFVQPIVMAANLSTHASKGMLPVQGGTLDQSAWFMDFWQRLESDTAKIDRDRIERERARR